MGVIYSSNTTQPGDVVTYDIYVDLAISQLYSVMYYLYTYIFVGFCRLMQPEVLLPYSYYSAAPQGICACHLYHYSVNYDCTDTFPITLITRTISLQPFLLLNLNEI